MNRNFLLAVLCLLAVACNRVPVEFRNTDLTGATFARQFTLSDHNAQIRTLGDFKGKVVVIFFGYASCPDICPSTLSRLAAVMKALGPESERVQVLFVTVDPDRDTADRLRDFVPWFHPSFLGLRGNAQETKAVSEEFRIFSARREVGSQLGYVLDHSSGAYVYDPAGRIRLYVKDTASVEEIVADIRLLLSGK
ncbi:MAG: SCO family protein [Azonexus sp.]|jgi:protein SCO1/2|nr:SCO family protein [Azonexus sp.]